MQDKLLAEFPDVAYETWRAQVDKDLKGADFDKRLVTRTLEGLTIQPLYTARDGASEPDAGGFAGLAPYRRGPAAIGSFGRQWDIRAEQRAATLERAQRDIAEDLAGGASSLWLRFDAGVRTGSPDKSAGDGLPCADGHELAVLLAGTEHARIALDAGGNLALAATYLGLAPAGAGAALGCDPLGALARDGVLPYDLPRAAELFGELLRECAGNPQLRAAYVSSEPYHAAGADCVQELAYALGTGLTYLRWGLDAGLDLDQISTQLEFGVAVGADLFMELAKLRALRLCWSKLLAAHGGGERAQNTRIHAFTSPRTKTRKDPWVNMLRSTTEAFAAMVGGADALTTRGFDEAIGSSDGFARRIGRNVQTILNEEAHVTRVADAAGGSYYVETLTDQLARAAWTQFQAIERRGGMPSALCDGSIARDIAASAEKRASAVAKRSTPILGVSEYANVSEQPVQREPAKPTTAARSNSSSAAEAALAQLRAAGPGQRLAHAVQAARAGASVQALSAALSSASPTRCEPLPVRRNAEPFELLRARAERHAAKAGAPPRAFLCNLGEVPKHKARAAFSTGFLNAGGVEALDNEGFASVADAVAAFASSGTQTVIVCGSDDQYPSWLPELVPQLRQRGASQILVAGRPGEHQAAWEQAGVTRFIYVGVDVVASLGQLLDGMGVAP